jgi:hypothetical protein
LHLHHIHEKLVTTSETKTLEKLMLRHENTNNWRFRRSILLFVLMPHEEHPRTWMWALEIWVSSRNICTWYLERCLIVCTSLILLWVFI